MFSNKFDLFWTTTLILMRGWENITISK